MPEPDWWKNAACKREPHFWFFPEPGPGADHAAKAVCRGCEVRQDCLSFAIRHHEQHGVWGGLNAHERQRIEDGAKLRDLWCSWCARPFSIWWERGKPPVFCSESCRTDARNESHRKSHRRAG